MPSLCFVLYWLIIDVTMLPVNQSLSAPNLDAWPRDIADKLDAVIRDNAHSGAYTCFDADQTSYQWGLTESAFVYLEMNNIITREKLDPALKLIPFLDTMEHKESFSSYYNRLCTTIDDVVCYTWIAQVFAGMTLNQLKIYVDEMLKLNTGNTTIKTVLNTLNNNTLVQAEYNVHIPNFYKAQQELYNRLMENGIEVYVITAAQEEVVRMVLADTKYNYNVKPQNVIGIATLLKDDTQLTISRKQIKDNIYDQKKNFSLTLTSYLWSPQAMFAGKYAAILTNINQWKMPIIVAGDTHQSDGYMKFHAYNHQRGTIRLWVNRKNTYLTQIHQMKDDHVRPQKQNNLTIAADKDWIYITPNELVPTTGKPSDFIGTSESMSLVIATMANQHTFSKTNKATKYQYEILVLLISLFLTYI